MQMPRSKRLDYYVVMTNRDHSALTDELKLGEDNSNPIKVHPELNCVPSPRPRVHMLVIDISP